MTRTDSKFFASTRNGMGTSTIVAIQCIVEEKIFAKKRWKRGERENREGVKL